MRSKARTLLTERNAADLLRRLGVLPADAEPEISALSGGVANVVLAISWTGGDVVIKQALPKLRVAADWRIDPSRTLIEREALDYIGAILSPGSVPEVLAFDPDECLLVMSRAPAGGTVWKRALLAGEAETEVAEQLGAMMGCLHRESAADPDLAERFPDRWPLTQGRTDPYHRTVADRYPEARAAILSEAERLEGARRCLVHGDCSPKNVITYPDRPPMLLDFEVAHVGDPGFDVAFMLTHLTLKAVYSPGAARALRDCADAFLTAYEKSAGTVATPEPDVVVEFACLLLSRIDGKSPVEYIGAEADREAVRRTALDLLAAPPVTLAGALDLAFARLTAGSERTP